MKQFLAVAATMFAVPALAAPPKDTAAGEQRFRELYKELVETNTTLSAGSCTLAAERMAARLKAAGFPDSDLHLFAAPDHPKEGGLVAVYPGRDPKLKAILLLAHIDVVEAKREDWTRDPFTLVEENGSFYARGASDDKAEAAIWVDTLIRYRAENYKPRRTLKVALTCGEETAGAFNGAQWLTQNRRELIDAAFALNEGAAGELDAEGRRVSLDVEAGEKFPQNYRLEVTNPGGHSSRPVKDNAIYHLAAALTRVGAYDFPAQFTDANRAYFTGMAKIQAAKGETENGERDERVPARSRRCAARWRSCRPRTRAGTRRCARPALRPCSTPGMPPTPCRSAPGQSSIAAFSRASARRACAPSSRSWWRTRRSRSTALETRGPTSSPPPLTPAVLGPIEKLAAEFWPGVPVLPILQAGATDGEFTNAVGIPTFGVEPVFVGPDLGHIHGLNEYIGVKSLLEGREFLYRLVKIYADQK